MQIELLTSIGGNATEEMGSRGIFAFQIGQVVDLPAPLATKWVTAGIAKSLEAPIEPTHSVPEVEQAVVIPAAEQAVSRKSNRRRR